MKLYKLIYSSDSPINEMPDAQKVFGSLCQIIKYTLGEEQLQNYLNSFASEPWLVHSSMFVNGFFPMIKKNVFNLETVNNVIAAKESNKKLEALSMFKKIKKASQMSEKVYFDYVAGEKIESLTEDILNGTILVEDGVLTENVEDRNKIEKSARSDNFRVRLDNENEDKRLFNDSALYFDRNTEFCIFVKTSQPTEMIKQLFGKFDLFALGNKASIGRNLFKLKTIEQMDLKNHQAPLKMILSKYIPNNDEIILSQSYYNINSRFSYGSHDYLGNAEIGMFNSFSEGSLMYFNKEDDYYGRLVKTEINGKAVYHYGIAFVV